MRYLTIDGMVSGTGVRDRYSGEYIVPANLGISLELSDRMTHWLERYKLSFYKGNQDLTVVTELDEEGLEICRCVSIALPGCKVGYYSDALCKNLVWS